jgi:hypothetical protein
MSTLDTMTPLISSPWPDASGKPLSVRALPGFMMTSGTPRYPRRAPSELPLCA